VVPTAIVLSGANNWRGNDVGVGIHWDEADDRVTDGVEVLAAGVIKIELKLLFFVSDICG